MENSLELMPKIVVRDSAVDALCHGASLTAPGVVRVDTGIQKDSLVAVMTIKGEAITLSKATETTEQILNLQHGVVASPERVLMPRGTYPKVWKSGSGHEQKK
jgi:H/ACA ribonucleoprotein complex subunit 4